MPGSEKGYQVGLHQSAVNTGGTRLIQHGRGGIDADQAARPSCQQPAAQTGAAAEIDHTMPETPGAEEGLQEPPVAAIAQLLDEVPIVIRGVLVE